MRRVVVVLVVGVALVTMAACKRDTSKKSVSNERERPTPGLVGTWATTELGGDLQSPDEDYWLFRADGTMVECNTVVGPMERRYEVTDGGLVMKNLSDFGTDIEVLSMQDGKMHVKFLGIEKKLEKLPASDSRKFRCDGVKRP